MASATAIALYPYPVELPDPLSTAAGCLSDVAALMADTSADVDDRSLLLASSWRSSSATAAVADVRQLAPLLRGDAHQLGSAAAAVRTYVRAIDHARARIDTLRTRYDDAVHDRDIANRTIDPSLHNRGPIEDAREGNQAVLDTAKAGLDRELARVTSDLLDDSATALRQLTAVLDALAPIIDRPATDPYSSAAFTGVGQSLLLLSKVGAEGSSVRRATQARAFERTFGRPPAGPTDWKTAAMLDSTSYQTKNGSTSAVVQVGRITPHPGMGLVRIGLYIPSGEVFNVPHYDLGDNRGPDQDFDPEQTRVTLYIDYETGVVIARQNPSVSTTGEVRVQTPAIAVQELHDGSVHIAYDAANPFSPPDPTNTHTVRGDLAVRPPSTPGGTWHLDGSIGDYPAFEAYQDDPLGTTQVLDRDAADNDGSFGPLLELPGHHDIGDGQGPLYRFRTRRALSGPYYEYLPSPASGLGDPADPPTVPDMPEYNDAWAENQTRVYSA